MSSILAFGMDEEINDWVSARVFGSESFPADSKTIGLIKGDKIVAGVVYTRYTINDICMNVASSGNGWLTRSFLRAVFSYPFKQLRCTRVSALTRVDNPKAIKFIEHLGFVREGLIRQGEEDGCDLIMYGMLRDECKWIDI